VPGASKPGTGLGLFIARSIAEAHGGMVEVSSGPAPGSTFTLTLPVSETIGGAGEIRARARD
jgi:signal transduction histidine kinase